jgi:glycosyltransferase involved in cell wall biosynthesis
MRVLLLTNHVDVGGITAYLLNLCSALHGRDGFEYVIASRGGELEGEFAKMGVRHIRLPLTTKCEVSPKVGISFLKLRPLMREYSLDAIHAHTRVTQVLASFLSAATKKPYLSTCHGYFKPRLTRRLWPCWGQKVIAISDPVRDHLIEDFRWDPRRIALIYNGVDISRFHDFDNEAIAAEKKRLGLDPGKKVVGHIGRLSSVKGQKYMVLAAAQICRARNDAQFLIIGDGEEEGALKQVIKENNLEGVFFLRSSVKDTALALSLMDIFVLPSLQEGLGLSLLEAQAQGVPVIATRVGGILSAVTDARTGLLCPAADPAALAGAVLRLLEDESLRQALVLAAKKQIEEKFSLSVMALRTRQVYEETSTLMYDPAPSL